MNLSRIEFMSFQSAVQMINTTNCSLFLLLLFVCVSGQNILLLADDGHADTPVEDGWPDREELWISQSTVGMQRLSGHNTWRSEEDGSSPTGRVDGWRLIARSF